MRSTMILWLCCAPVALAGAGNAPSFTILGDLPGGGVGSGASNISRDGSTVIGTGNSTAGASDGFIWRPSQGFTLFSSIPGAGGSASPRALSADGSVIVGQANFNAFRYDSRGFSNIGALPPLDGGFSSAWGVSGDGTLAIGTGPGDGFDAILWTGSNSAASIDPFTFEGRAISDDGAVASVTVAQSGVITAHRWTSQKGLLSMQRALANDNTSEATAMTPDGSISVGFSSFTSQSGDIERSNAMRWDESGNGQALGTLFPNAPAPLARARAVSADGSVIVGQESVFGTATTVAFLWTQHDGMQNLTELALSLGIDMGDDVSLLNATGITGDGRTIVGTARLGDGTNSAYILTIPAPAGAGALVLGAMFSVRRRR